MNTKRLIDKVYDSFPRSDSLSKKKLALVIEKVFESISEEIIKEHTVQIYWFGSFVVSYRKSRIGINPQTLESITIPDVKTIRFKPATKTKQNLNKKI